MADETMDLFEWARKKDKRAIRAAQARAKRAANPGRDAAYMRARRAKNPDAELQIRRSAYQRNIAVLRQKSRLRMARRRVEKRDDVLAYQRAYYARTAEKWREKARTPAVLYRKNEQRKISRKLNPDKYRIKERRARNDRYKSDPQFRITVLLRTRLNGFLRRKGGKRESAVRLLGCTVAELMVHLERQFLSGMTWVNHGRYGWHVDHKRPLASFDLRDPEQLQAAAHYTNLQPLWAIDNLRKKATVTPD